MNEIKMDMVRLVEQNRIMYQAMKEQKRLILRNQIICGIAGAVIVGIVGLMLFIG